MSLEAEGQRNDIHRRYPPAGSRDIALSLALAAIAIAIDRFLWSIGWPFLIGAVVGILGWGVTKFRLRRNADKFLSSPPSH